MATSTLRAYAADMVVPLAIVPGGLDGLLALLGDRPNPLLKYRNGTVLLVSPGEDHERAVQRLDFFVMALCMALRIEFCSYRSTLFRMPGHDHGVMPDLSYYIQSESAVRGISGQIDLQNYPPPDLAVEIVVTHGPKLAMEVCRELGVPELWVYDVVQRKMSFRQWRQGASRDSYVLQERSLAFPFVRAVDIPPWLEGPNAGDRSEFLGMQRWAKTALARWRKREESR